MLKRPKAFHHHRKIPLLLLQLGTLKFPPEFIYIWLTEGLLPWCQQITFSPVTHSGPDDYQRNQQNNCGHLGKQHYNNCSAKGQKQKESTIYTMKFNTASCELGCRIFLAHSWSYSLSLKLDESRLIWVSRLQETCTSWNFPMNDSFTHSSAQPYVKTGHKQPWNSTETY